MSTISASTTSTTAFKVTSDTTGTLVFQTGAVPTTAISIDASQAVGIGTASPAAKLDVSAGSAAAQITSTTTSAGAIPKLTFSHAGNDAFSIVGGTYMAWLSSGTTERMRLDTSGNLGIGTSSITPVFGTTVRIFNSGSGGTLEVGGSSVNARLIAAQGLGLGGVGTSSNHPFTFATNDTERARITSGGTLVLNGTAARAGSEFLTVYQTAGSTSAYFGTTAQGLYISNDSTTPRLVRLSSSGNFGGGFIFTNGNTDVGTFTLSNEFIVGGTTDQGAYNLQCNGTGVWGAGAYVNGSDARLKDNIQSLDSGLDVVKAMRPVTFQYKPEYSKDQSVQPGFIAQELQEAMAGKAYLEGVVQEGTNHLNVAYQNIIPILVKAIQELEAKFAALESK